jgi:DNA polymerase III gamma/tau subunit
MVEELLIHPATEQKIKLFTANPRGSLLITGRSGAGKTTLALLVAAKLLNQTIDEVINYPHLIRIVKADNKQEIPIDDIRSLTRRLQLKTIGRRQIRRVVIIEDSHFMSHEAQNALLKILEEPPVDTVFILTANSSLNVLPTVASRLQIIDALPITLESADNYFKAIYDAKYID